METLIEGFLGDGTRTRTDCHDGSRWHPDVFRNQKEYEPTLLVPMGLGTIFSKFPELWCVLSAGGEPGPFQVLFDMGISTELFPLLLFIGIGAMIDFGPLLQNPFCFYLGLQPNLVFSLRLSSLFYLDLI